MKTTIKILLIMSIIAIAVGSQACSNESLVGPEVKSESFSKSSNIQAKEFQIFNKERVHINLKPSSEYKVGVIQYSPSEIYYIENEYMIYDIHQGIKFSFFIGSECVAVYTATGVQYANSGQ